MNLLEVSQEMSSFSVFPPEMGCSTWRAVQLGAPQITFGVAYLTLAPRKTQREQGDCVFQCAFCGERVGRGNLPD